MSSMNTKGDEDPEKRPLLETGGKSVRFAAEPGKPSRRSASLRRSMYGSISGSAHSLGISDDEVDAMIDEFAREDKKCSSKKTWSRRFVEGVLQKYRWYFPKKQGPNAPSLEKAWAYYEHVTLPRFFVGGETTSYIFRRAEPGETSKTELFDPIRTPRTALGEWGIGVDLYFSTLRSLSAIFLIAAFVNIPNIMYYASPEYTGPHGQDALPLTLRGSTICTDLQWAVCEDCKEREFELSEEHDRYATHGNSTILVQHSVCKGAELSQGIINWATLLLIVGLIAFLCYYLQIREIRSDADRVTSSDYSVLVRNPPPDAFDVEEWKEFFSQFAHKQVVAVTVSLNNEGLLRQLIARRVYKNSLRLMLPKGIDMDDDTAVQNAVANLIREQQSMPKSFLMKCMTPLLQMGGLMSLSPQTLMKKISDYTEKVKKLQEKHYDVTNVFVTFETEEGQRAALTALSVGRLASRYNIKSSVAPEHTFQGRVLDVVEPPEASAVRWLDLSTGPLMRRLLSAANFLATLAMVGFAGYLVDLTRAMFGPEYSGPLVVVFNTMIPTILRETMQMERHASEGGYQTSLYVKITLFRWMNTAVLTRIITPFTRTLGASDLDVLPTINAVLLSEVWCTPLLNILDMYTNFQKHVLAPRANTQEEMNLYFQGTAYNMGERYTDLTKILFLCFMYSSLQPLVFFYGAIILITQSYVDKFCLMRIWSWAPAIGPELAVFSRRYFFSGALVAFALASTYTYARFPYDNICPGGSETGVAGYYPEAVTLNGDVIDINVIRDESVAYCSQHWTIIKEWDFPSLPRIDPSGGAPWMTDSQETLVEIYGWTSVILIAVLLGLFALAFLANINSLFWGTYKPEGHSQKIDFSNVTEIFGYVPQAKAIGFAFPFIACNIDKVDRSMIGWIDPSHNYDFHNLIFDVPFPGMHRQRVRDNDENSAVSASDAEQHSDSETHRPIFGIMQHWPPPWQQELLS